MKRVSEKTKASEGRGMGRGANYEPYVKVSDFGSEGICSNPIDWKSGRTVHLLSQGEAILWHLLRWDIENADIREQYPLQLGDTLRICDHYGIRHPKNRMTPMTTDFYVTKRDGTSTAISLKSSPSVLENRRTVEKLFVEMHYWKTQGIPYELVFKESLNVVLFNNIRQVVEYYSVKRVHDDISVLKHLIATRRIVIPNMDSVPLDFAQLVHVYGEEINLWKKCRLKLG